MAVTVLLITLLGVMAVSAQSGRQVSGRSDVIRLAERGYAPAQTRLGFMFASGQGVPQNEMEAVEWYKRAAEQGDPDAQYLLGVSFDLAKGVPMDWVLAYKWLNLSVARTRPGNEREHRARMRDAIASKLSRPELEEARNLAIAWRPKPERQIR